MKHRLVYCPLENGSMPYKIQYNTQPTPDPFQMSVWYDYGRYTSLVEAMQAFHTVAGYGGVVIATSG